MQFFQGAWNTCPDGKPEHILQSAQCLSFQNVPGSTKQSFVTKMNLQFLESGKKHIILAFLTAVPVSLLGDERTALSKLKNPNFNVI